VVVDADDYRASRSGEGADFARQLDDVAPVRQVAVTDELQRRRLGLLGESNSLSPRLCHLELPHESSVDQRFAAPDGRVRPAAWIVGLSL
jgi:hypothetical protein